MTDNDWRKRAETAEREVERLTHQLADIRRLVDVSPDETLEAAIERLTQERDAAQAWAREQSIEERELRAENARLTAQLKDERSKVAVIATMLGWGNVPPLSTLEREIAILKQLASAEQLNAKIVADEGSSDGEATPRNSAPNAISPPAGDRGSGAY